MEADWSGLERAVAPSGSSLPLPRLLVVLAHPDDEVLALGGRLERLASSRLLTITDGAPKDGSDARQHGFPTLEAYREARRDELGKALAHAGLGLGVTPVFGGQVPDQAASFHLVALARGIASAIEDFKPEVVLTHPYEGGHPDHDACAFAVHAAVRMFCG
ncbi:MAG TPA: PIG-L family deacetylase, partial [Acidobacteriaceae bacterium]|nr:PIG-L family deacetylase [Acidobacteriaceae bacterium]